MVSFVSSGVIFMLVCFDPLAYRHVYLPDGYTQVELFSVRSSHSPSRFEGPMHDWTTITTVFGEAIKEPTESDMRRALDELFSSADDEHPDTWIERGSQNGPLYCISVYARGYAVSKKYSDADMTEELESEVIADVDVDIALNLWRKLGKH